MNEFEIGKTYIMPGLYIPSFRIVIEDKRAEKLQVHEVEFPEESFSLQIEKYSEGERVLAYEYHGVQGYMYPMPV